MTRYLLRILNDDPITVELVGYSDSDWAGDPASRMCGDEQRNGGVLRDVIDGGRTATLEDDSGALWIQSEHDAFLRHGGCARYCAESWIGEAQGTRGENSVVARGCSRERATGQVDCFEGKQGGLGNESIAGSVAEHVAKGMWKCGPRRTVESNSGGRERIGP